MSNFSDSASSQKDMASVAGTSTKFRPANQNIIRDFLIAFVPIFVLFKLATHPMIDSIGYIDPNAPKKLSQEEALADIIKTMALDKYKVKYKKRRQLLEVVDPQKCYDFTSRIKAAEETIAKSNMVNSNRRAKKKQRPTIKRINKSHGKKKKMQFGRKRSSSRIESKPSGPPVASSFLFDVMLVFSSSTPTPKPAMKGAENYYDLKSMPREKTKKRKFSFKR